MPPLPDLKIEVDQLGLQRDITIHISRFRSYMADKVEIAHKAIYTLGKPIGSTAVE